MRLFARDYFFNTVQSNIFGLLFKLGQSLRVFEIKNVIVMRKLLSWCYVIATKYAASGFGLKSVIALLPIMRHILDLSTEGNYVTFVFVSKTHFVSRSSMSASRFVMHIAVKNETFCC